MESLVFDFNIYSDANFYYVAAIAYLIGCVPFAVVVGYFGGVGDIRKLGSGNPGATNMARHGSKRLGAVTLLLDAGKGAAAVYIGRYFSYPAAAALFAVLGHCFSLFLKFKGGKGVAATLGSLLMLYWPAGLTYLGAWLAAFVLWRISSLSALIGIWLTALVATFAWYGNLSFLIFFFAVLITARHKSNIQKLAGGSED
jgi:glycerol-3-phosphate acyltransferase PlsY